MRTLCLLWLYQYYVLWAALLRPHLDRPESSAHFSAAVLLCNFQVSSPASEDQQSALQLPQVVSVPWREGAAIATLQVTKITRQLNPYKHMWWIDKRWESGESEEHNPSKNKLELIKLWTTILHSFIIIILYCHISCWYHTSGRD